MSLLDPQDLDGHATWWVWRRVFSGSSYMQPVTGGTQSVTGGTQWCSDFLQVKGKTTTAGADVSAQFTIVETPMIVPARCFL